VTQTRRHATVARGQSAPHAHAQAGGALRVLWPLRRAGSPRVRAALASPAQHTCGLGLPPRTRSRALGAHAWRCGAPADAAIDHALARRAEILELELDGGLFGRGGVRHGCFSNPPSASGAVCVAPECTRTISAPRTAAEIQFVQTSFDTSSRASARIARAGLAAAPSRKRPWTGGMVSRGRSRGLRRGASSRPWTSSRSGCSCRQAAPCARTRTPTGPVHVWAGAPARAADIVRAGGSGCRQRRPGLAARPQVCRRPAGAALGCARGGRAVAVEGQPDGRAAVGRVHGVAVFHLPRVPGRRLAARRGPRVCSRAGTRQGATWAVPWV
jgi:hypothetical protein